MPYATPVYHFDNIGRIPLEELQFHISDQLFFEKLLLENRGKTIAYSSHKNKIESLRE